jgi:hypothetical protein
MTMAVLAGIRNDLTFTVTRWAGLLYREEALLHTHLAHTTTSTTSFSAGTRFCSCAITVLTGYERGNLNRFFYTTYRLFKAEIHGITKISTPLNRTTPTTTTATKDITEDITEYVGKATIEPTGTATHVRINPGMAILIVGALFLRI